MSNDQVNHKLKMFEKCYKSFIKFLHELDPDDADVASFYEIILSSQFSTGFIDDFYDKITNAKTGIYPFEGVERCFGGLNIKRMYDEMNDFNKKKFNYHLNILYSLLNIKQKDDDNDDENEDEKEEITPEKLQKNIGDLLSKKINAEDLSELNGEFTETDINNALAQFGIKMPDKLNSMMMNVMKNVTGKITQKVSEGGVNNMGDLMKTMANTIMEDTSGIKDKMNSGEIDKEEMANFANDMMTKVGSDPMMQMINEMVKSQVGGEGSGTAPNGDIIGSLVKSLGKEQFGIDTSDPMVSMLMGQKETKEERARRRQKQAEEKRNAAAKKRRRRKK